tara:strand:- start:7978 stop:8313 length:336 start_codon:yes stop_codon:yes gene_type:complete
MTSREPNVIRIIVLLNLKPGKDENDYLQWARTTDLPTVNSLKSVENFELLECTSLLRGGPAPYQYIEILDVSDMDAFKEEAGSEAMRKIAAEFNDWATPIFIVTNPVGTSA